MSFLRIVVLSASLSKEFLVNNCILLGNFAASSLTDVP